MLSLALAAALGLGLRPAQCDQFLSITGDQFTYGGVVYKIKGANYYPASAPWGAMFGNWNWDEITTDVEMLRSLGINAMRINLPYSAGGWGGPNVNQLYLDRLERLVELLRAKGMKANITLFDWETSFPAAGTQRESEHKQYVAAIVNRLKDNPGVFLWDVKNEPDHPSNIDDHDNWDYSPANRDKIVSWLSRMCAYVRSLDPNHPVSAGIRWWENVSDVISFVDVAIFHNYWPNIGTEAIPFVKQACGANPKPILVQEFGWPSQPRPCWRDTFWVYDYTEANQLSVYQMNLQAFAQHDIAGGIQWQACDLAPYVADPNFDPEVTFENYFGLWKFGTRQLKPAASYYRDNWPAARFPYADSSIPDPPTGVSAAGLDREVRISWTHSSSADCAGTLIRYSTTGYPAGPADGDFAAEVSGEGKSAATFLHTGLERNSTYYYSLFAYDYAGNYSAGATAVASTAYQPANLLSGPEIDVFESGIAAGWTAYERYGWGTDGPVMFSPDSSVSVSGGVSQRIEGFDSAVLPSAAGQYAHAGIFQQVAASPGKVYLLLGHEKLTGGSSDPLYFRTFGIAPSGSVEPGAPGPGNVADARWMGDGRLFRSDEPGGSNTTSGMYRCISAVTAEAPVISCWAGIGISLADGRLPGDRINYDQFFLHEFDAALHSTPANGGFEGSVIECFDSGIYLPEGWLPAGGGYGKFLGFQVNSSTGIPRTGSKCATMFCYPGRCELGLMQRVAAYRGETVSASVYVRGVAGNAPTVSAAIGIDPTGGVDMFADTVVWGTISVGNSTVWAPVSVSTRAESTSVTVFIRSSSGDHAAGYHTVFADDVTFSAALNSSSPGDALWLPDGRPLTLNNCVVSAVFDGYFYVQDADRTSGVKIVSAAAVSPGQTVDVWGTMGTSAGERHIAAASVTVR